MFLTVSRLRSSEWLLIAYFTYVAIVAAWFFSPWKAWALAAVVAALVWFAARWQPIVRDLLPAALTLVAYREMNWFSPAVYDHRLEQTWVTWDRQILDGGLRAAIESAGAVLSFVLELSYLLVYAIGPVSVVLVMWTGNRSRVNRFWVTYLIAALGAYALFPYFPTEPPRTAFAGADLSSMITAVRRFNLWILGSYGIHASVFPSAHVSSALGAAWGLLAAIPDRRWIGWTIAAYALTVAVATIYGRYHYAADAAAGIFVSLFALAASRSFVGRPPWSAAAPPARL